MLKLSSKPILKRNLILFLLGGLAALAFAPTYLFPLLFISFSGFLLYINRCNNKREAFWTGWCFGFGHFVVGIYWICISLLVEPLKFAWLIPFTISLIPAALGVYIGLVSMFTFLISRRLNINGISKVSLFCLLWGFSEFLRGYMFSGFPWNLIGYVWSFSDYMIQIASVIGVYGLGIITVFIVTLPVIIVEEYLKVHGNSAISNKPQFIKVCFMENIGKLNPILHCKKIRIPGFKASSRANKIDNFKKELTTLNLNPLFYCIALMLLIWLFGFIRLQNAEISNIEGVKIRIVQPNISQKQKWNGNTQYKAFMQNIILSRSPGFENVSHVIWPETAIPYIVNGDGRIIEDLKQAIPDNGVLISGGLRGIFDKNGQIKKLWNSVFVFNKQEGLSNFYDKSHLVPFGEYIPFSKFIPFVDKITHGSIDFNRGDGIKTMYVTSGPNNSLTLSFSPLVCYEAIFPNNVIDTDNRPDFMLNLTNDAWFGVSSGPYQHFDMVRMRSVEYGIPLIRTANTGISGSVDSYGQILRKLSLQNKDFLDVNLQKKLNYTIYSYISQYYFLFLVLIFVLFLNIFFKKLGNNL